MDASRADQGQISDHSPASPLLSMEALSMSVPVRRATTLPPGELRHADGRSGCQHCALQTIASEHFGALCLEHRFVNSLC